MMTILNLTSPHSRDFVMVWGMRLNHPLAGLKNISYWAGDAAQMEGRFFASKYPERKQKHLYIYMCVYEVTYIDPQKKNRRLLIESTR